MRKIEVIKWTAKDAEGKDVTDSSLSLFSAMINMKKPESLPKGLDAFRLFSRLSNAFIQAETSNVLCLEETEYKFLMEIITSDIPASWGMNPNILRAIDIFTGAKQE